MEKYNVSVIAEIVGMFATMEEVLNAKRQQIGEVALPDDLRDGFGHQMSKAFELCKEISIIECLPILRTAESHIADKTSTLGMAQSEIRHVREGILKQLEKWEFVPIRPELAKYLEQQALFGMEVFQAFVDARDDIRESGNCIAVEANTAAVFHLMRVAEHGLRRIAKQLRVRLSHSGKTHPIEYADWNKIITAIQIKITEARKKTPGPKKEAILERYSDAADHCLFMKDIWRNAISHARKPYSGPEALSVSGRVRAFMEFVAIHIA